MDMTDKDVAQLYDAVTVQWSKEHFWRDALEGEQQIVKLILWGLRQRVEVAKWEHRDARLGYHPMEKCSICRRSDAAWLKLVAEKMGIEL